MKLNEFIEINRVQVYKNDLLIGYLIRNKSGATFEYTQNYFESDLPQLSFLINKNSIKNRVNGENLHPYFAGLLPEGQRLKALQKSLKTSASDLFSLIIASGKELIGDVYVIPENYQENTSTSICKLDQVDFLELFNSSIVAEDYSTRLLDNAFPGIQAKLSAGMISFPVKYTKRKKSYILKLETKEFPNLVKNEHFFMNLAELCGLDVAKTQIVFDRNNNPGLLVERFDRKYDQNKKKFKSLHQEDACQFLNLYPQDKYRLHFRQIAKGIEQFSSAPIIEISKLIDLLVFSYVIANGDLHAKNISLIQSQTDNITLAPAYDLLSTLPYGDQAMALSFEGKKDNLTFQSLKIFAKSFNVNEKVLKKSIDRISQIVQDNLDKLEELNFTRKKITFLEKIIKKRILDINQN